MLTRSPLKVILLASGIAASLLYAAIDITGGILWHGYSYSSQAISELAAIGSPTRQLLAPLYPIYSILMIAFGIGLLLATKRSRVQYIGGLQIVIGAIGIAWTPFPMHLDQSLTSPANAVHSTFADTQTVFILSSLGMGTIALGKRFGYYSAGAFVIVIASAMLTFTAYSFGMQGGWFGLVERITVYGYMVWIIVLSIAMLHAETNKTSFALAKSSTSAA